MVLFVQRPVRYIALNLENAGVNRVRTVRLARSIGVVGTPQINRRRVQNCVGRFVGCWILCSRAAERQCYCKCDIAQAWKNSAREARLRAIRTSNVMTSQVFDSNKALTRATRRLTSAGVDFPTTSLCLLMLLTRLAVGLEPLNALDAAHRSPRSRSAFAEQKLVPPLDRQLADPLSETKN